MDYDILENSNEVNLISHTNLHEENNMKRGKTKE